jgi:hypothetical protein
MAMINYDIIEYIAIKKTTIVIGFDFKCSKYVGLLIMPLKPTLQMFTGVRVFHRVFLQYLQGKPYDNYRISLQSVNITVKYCRRTLRKPCKDPVNIFIPST